MRRMPYFLAVDALSDHGLIGDIAHRDYFLVAPIFQQALQEWQTQLDFRFARSSIAQWLPQLVGMKGEGIPNEGQ